MAGFELEALFALLASLFSFLSIAFCKARLKVVLLLPLTATGGLALARPGVNFGIELLF